MIQTPKDLERKMISLTSRKNAIKIKLKYKLKDPTKVRVVKRISKIKFIISNSLTLCLFHIKVQARRSKRDNQYANYYHYHLKETVQQSFRIRLSFVYKLI